MYLKYPLFFAEFFYLSGNNWDHVEQVFGHWVNEMGGKLMGSIGKQSVKATIGVKNLVYNFKRYGFWENKNPKAVG